MDPSALSPNQPGVAEGGRVAARPAGLPGYPRSEVNEAGMNPQHSARDLTGLYEADIPYIIKDHRAETAW